MALQLPFLYGFYRVLDQAIELRHAPWILWVKDLSAPDNFHLFGYPFPILPILMVVTMFTILRAVTFRGVSAAQLTRSVPAAS